MILMIDNYDSFTYNLVQALGVLNPDIHVVRNDKITAEGVLALNPSHVVLSPGPGFPKDAGISEELVRALAGRVPILGVCLGHQAIGEAFGGQVVHAPHLVHGKAAPITLKESPLFAGLPKRIQAGRYHSLVVDPKTLPASLVVTAETDTGEIMAFQHREYPVFGLQFHPESILTPQGPTILENFLQISLHNGSV